MTWCFQTVELKRKKGQKQSPSVIAAYHQRPLASTLENLSFTPQMICEKVDISPCHHGNLQFKMAGVFPHVLPVSRTMVSVRDRWGWSQRYLAGCQVGGLLTVSDSRGNRRLFWGKSRPCAWSSIKSCILCRLRFFAKRRSDCEWVLVQAQRSLYLCPSLTLWTHKLLSLGLFSLLFIWTFILKWKKN